MKSNAKELALAAIASIQRPRIYIAAPLPLFGSRRYEAAIMWAEHTFRGSEFFPSHLTFASIGEWRELWPLLAQQINLALVVTHADGVVGRGVFAELSDLGKRQVPVLWWLSQRKLCPAFRMKVIDRDNWRRYACLSPLKPRGKNAKFLLQVIL